MVSIAVLTAAGVRFEWYEALAIVQELCGAVVESVDQAGANTLGPDTIFIDPVGQVVTVTASQQPATAVPRVATILKTLLPPFHARSTFHEVIDKATANPPGYTSLQELS